MSITTQRTTCIQYIKHLVVYMARYSYSRPTSGTVLICNHNLRSKCERIGVHHFPSVMVNTRYINKKNEFIFRPVNLWARLSV